MRLSHIPLRVTTGAFILNSGLSKRGLPEEAAAGIHGMAAGSIPQFGSVPPKTFVAGLSTGEMALGAALLLPFVSPVVAGAALTAFGAGLVNLYLKTPGLTEQGSVRPTQDGIGIAKDVWLVGVGTTLLMDGLVDGARGAARNARKSARKSAKKARKNAAALASS
ncbi:MAG: hypothetical protein AVDCRST_MAG07-221 [uncultured Frankineae bacterium]|uniref:Arginine/ornithine antiporter ArcD n=1 Tax=uncultured Frankineae bacterium TaxID=437475 RepID=A0A6J4KKT9_9ACTN|nr:MAG: hypothetical protein AVDCRST_MAG07-221 [uncultured Frankineae bacterium]